MVEDSDTWLPFTRSEVNEIRSAVVGPGVEIACPVCGGRLELRGPRGNVWEVRCRPCRRHTVLRDVSGQA